MIVQVEKTVILSLRKKWEQFENWLSPATDKQKGIELKTYNIHREEPDFWKIEVFYEMAVIPETICMPTLIQCFNVVLIVDSIEATCTNWYAFIVVLGVITLWKGNMMWKFVLSVRNSCTEPVNNGKSLSAQIPFEWPCWSTHVNSRNLDLY